MKRRLSVKTLTKRIRNLIPETECCTPKRAICDFERRMGKCMSKGDKEITASQTGNDNKLHTCPKATPEIKQTQFHHITMKLFCTVGRDIPVTG